eukprot:GFYU01001976.1.p1 GENE.GFYU01001976.1~~GFYU01001976.1.p1  ORF type:complete len:339 (-),score=85.77 GFYU01001976.1:613-1629(-)
MLIGKYQFGLTIGRGSYAKVVTALDTTTGEQVAAKVMDRGFIEQERLTEYVKKEIAVMWHLRHPNIVEIKDVLVTKSNIFIILELVTGGELYNKVVQCGQFTDEESRRCFRQLLSALEYCHERGVCHRDLKLENLLLDGDNNIKITDFGFSRHLNSQLRSAVGTPSYMAPEALEKQNYDGKAVDVWACGVILYIMLIGRYPFGDPNEPLSSLYTRIKNAQYELPSTLDKNCCKLLKAILEPDPSKRITMDGIKKDKWLNKGRVMPIEPRSQDVGSFQWPTEVDERMTDAGTFEEEEYDDAMEEEDEVDEWWTEEEGNIRRGVTKDPMTLRWGRSGSKS